MILPRSLKTVKVPHALDAAGERVDPRDAVPRGAYRCPSCSTEVVLRRGLRTRPHFAHRIDPASCGYGGESELHLLAKDRVVEAVAGGRKVFLRRMCRRCRGWDERLLFGKVKRAATEVMLPTGRRADVAMLDESESVIGVIEIAVTHRVDDTKAEDLRHCRWGEFRAETILNGDSWTPLRDNFTVAPCARCGYRPVGERSLLPPPRSWVIDDYRAILGMEIGIRRVRIERRDADGRCRSFNDAVFPEPAPFRVVETAPERLSAEAVGTGGSFRCLPEWRVEPSRHDMATEAGLREACGRFRRSIPWPASFEFHVAAIRYRFDPSRGGEEDSSPRPWTWPYPRMESVTTDLPP